MEPYLDIIKHSFSGYYHYLVTEITNPHWGNYFYWLLAISFIFWGLEVLIPWRKNQHNIRKDFWLDGFYMFFNFFLFSLIEISYSIASIDYYIESLFYGIFTKYITQSKKWDLQLISDIIGWKLSFTEL